MNRLIAELQRLYFLDGQQWHGARLDDGEGATLDLVGPDGRTRTLVVGFAKAADWELAAKLCQGVQEDLELPAPAVSVTGKEGYRVWFSLAEPVPAEEARAFLDALRLEYLAEVPAARFEFRPDIADSGLPDRSPVTLAPAVHAATGKWSAFIDPAMGGMFVDEPWLEMAPNLDKQADLLAGFESIKAEDFRRALDILQSRAEPDPAPAEDKALSEPAAAGRPGRARRTLNVGGNFGDPKSFLLAVMNDPSASAGQRIKAAKALLPYFEQAVPK